MLIRATHRFTKLKNIPDIIFLLFFIQLQLSCVSVLSGKWTGNSCAAEMRRTSRGSSADPIYLYSFLFSPSPLSPWVPVLCRHALKLSAQRRITCHVSGQVQMMGKSPWAREASCFMSLPCYGVAFSWGTFSPSIQLTQAATLIIYSRHSLMTLVPLAWSVDLASKVPRSMSDWASNPWKPSMRGVRLSETMFRKVSWANEHPHGRTQGFQLEHCTAAMITVVVLMLIWFMFIACFL